jgi:tRNA 2-thiocytidine biosynthesis protein TtcA
MNGNKPLYFTSKKVGKALWDYRMLREGDRVLMAVSGGKDSLSLLRIMKERGKFVPIDYEIIACHVDMGFPWVDTAVLREHFEREEVSYVIAPSPDGWKGDAEPVGCFWCSWNRRKALFDLAKKMGCTKIAFAHHMDDIIETMLMNLFFQGEIGTMQPYQDMFNGELAIIRPLAYVEETELARLASMLGLPVVTSQCPHDDTSKRRVMKGVIEELTKHNRNVKKNIFRSLKRVRAEYLLPHTDD